MAPYKGNAFHRYLTYHNYLLALSRLLGDLYPSDADLAHALAGLRGYQVFDRTCPADPADLEMVLRHGWYTELLMRQVAGCLDAFPFNAPWSMVQAWFSSAGVTQWEVSWLQ